MLSRVFRKEDKTSVWVQDTCCTAAVATDGHHRAGITGEMLR